MPSPDKDKEADDHSLVSRSQGELSRAGEEAKPSELAKRGLRELLAPRLLHVLSGHASYLSPKSWSPDGTKLFSWGGGQQGFVRIWDAASGSELFKDNGPKGSSASLDWRSASLEWSPDGIRVASYSTRNDGKMTVRVLDAASGEEFYTLKDNEGMAWSPDGTRLATGGTDNTVRVRDAGSGKELHSFKGHKGKVNTLGWSPDGSWLASNSKDYSSSDEAYENDGTVRVWDALNGGEVYVLQGAGYYRAGVDRITWSPGDGSRIFGWDSISLTAWDASSGSEAYRLNGGGYSDGDLSWDFQVAVSPDGSKLASGTHVAMNRCSTVKVWEALEGHEVHELEGHPDYVDKVVWSPDGSKLASVGWDGTVIFWDTINGRALQELKVYKNNPSREDYRDEIRREYKISWSLDGSKFVCEIMDQGLLMLWDAAGDRELSTIKFDLVPDFGFKSIFWSSDGSKFARQGDEDTIEIWSVP